MLIALHRKQRRIHESSTISRATPNEAKHNRRDDDLLHDARLLLEETHEAEVTAESGDVERTAPFLSGEHCCRSAEWVSTTTYVIECRDTRTGVEKDLRDVLKR